MEDTTPSPAMRYERPESRDGGKMGRLCGAVRRLRSTSWPAEVSNGARGVFTSHRTLTGLRALGLKVAQIRFEVRSRKGAGVWVMARGLGMRSLTAARSAKPQPRWFESSRLMLIRTRLDRRIDSQHPAWNGGPAHSQSSRRHFAGETAPKNVKSSRRKSPVLSHTITGRTDRLRFPRERQLVYLSQ